MGGGALSFNVSKLVSKEVSKICHLERSERSQTHPNLPLKREGTIRHAELVSASHNETVFSRFTSHFSRKRVAFTLAEVLITLGIVGVVCAMTIPTVINKFRQQVLNTQFKKAYSTLLNAHTLARYKWGTNPICYYGVGGNGSSANTDMDCEEFSKLFLQELKIAKNCGKNAMALGCIPQYKGWEKVKKENNPNMPDDEVQNAMKGCTNLSTQRLNKYPAFILNDGTIIMPGVGTGSEKISVNMIVDINGVKQPNKWGYDIFYFYTYFDGSKYILENVSAGCMPVEKGGRTTGQMIRYVNSY